MSGGAFEYKQYHITDIRNSIEHEIDKMGSKKDDEDVWYDDVYLKEHPEELYYYTYPDAIVNEFKNAINCLKKAEIYAQRIDWLLSGDDGEESFLERLKEDFDNLKENE